MELLLLSPEQVADAQIEARWKDNALYCDWDWSSFASDGGDAHLILCSAGEPVARATLFWKATPLYEGFHIGCVGHFAVYDRDAGAQLLAEAQRVLKANGVLKVVGPMNGNTWREYRVQSFSDNSPAFFLEQVAPSGIATCFEAAGFQQEYIYESCRGALADYRVHEDAASRRRRLAEQHLNLRLPRNETISDDLRGIYRVATACFSTNPYYTDLPEANFLEQYQALLPHVPLEQILLLERLGASSGESGSDMSNIVGFAFSCPDLEQLKYQERCEMAIFKTLAILPEFRGLRLGNLLIDSLAEALLELGYSQWIHAFMLRDNLTSKLALSRDMHCFREYVLYCKELADE